MIDGSELVIGRLNHIAIVVPDLTTSRERYLKLLGVSVTEPVDLHEHGVTVCFIELPNTKIELMAPLGAESPVSAFLERNPSGGMHHVCYEVEDIRSAREQLVAGGARVLGAGEPKIGAHGLPVLFLHPKDFDGTLIELEEVTK
jgi:methylmalonyl-CoA/ethylmalonyl-CoA epimerase